MGSEMCIRDRFSQGDTITFHLLRPDFTTARRVVEAINGRLGPDMAYAHDATSVSVRAPRDPSQRVSFLSILENIEVDPAEDAAKVVINSRTGTIVVGQNVQVSPAAVTHGNLTVTIAESPQVSQPLPFANGQTAVVPRSDVTVDEEGSKLAIVPQTVTLKQLVDGLNALGIGPRDMISILQAIKAAGALQADIEVL